MERKGGCRSAPPCVPPLSLCRSDPGSFSPSGFRRRPRWGQLKPSGALPVGGDFIAQQETPVKGAAHGFAATPLTGISRCAFCESPTEQIAQRACSRHEPTGGSWGETPNTKTSIGRTYTLQAISCALPGASGSRASIGSVATLPPNEKAARGLFSHLGLVGASPKPQKSGADSPAFSHFSGSTSPVSWSHAAGCLSAALTYPVSCSQASDLMNLSTT